MSATFTYKGRKHCKIKIVRGLPDSTRFNNSLDVALESESVEDIKMVVSPNGETVMIIVYADEHV